MSDIKAIFVDGIPGSGKSTLSAWITDRLANESLPAKMYHEMRDDHPLCVYAPAFTDLTVPSQARAYRDLHLERLKAYVARARQAQEISVFDSRLFQGTISATCIMRMPLDDAIAFALDLLDILMPLRPALIFIAQADVEANWRRICAERGQDWTQNHCGIKNDRDFVYAGITWSAVQAYCLALIRTWDIAKLVITNTDYDWARHQDEAAAFLDRVLLNP